MPKQLQPDEKRVEAIVATSGVSLSLSAVAVPVSLSLK